VLEDSSGRRSADLMAVLLASAVAAAVTRILLRDLGSLQLGTYSLGTCAAAVPLYAGLGIVSGAVASTFSAAAHASSRAFAGSGLPVPYRPVLGGFLCGLLGLAFPQVLFFGYDTLNQLLADADRGVPVASLLALLAAKIVATSVCLGAGLVGGTFAPSLFMGACTGASYHAAAQWFLAGADAAWRSTGAEAGLGALADVQAYAMVGASSVLASLFRAPLTGSLLLFELTRDYDVILPLMASAGVGSLVGDAIDDAVEKRRKKDGTGEKGEVKSGPLGLGLGRLRGR